MNCFFTETTGKGIKDHTILFVKKDKIVYVATSKANTVEGDIFSRKTGREIAYARYEKFLNQLENTDKDLTSPYMLANEVESYNSQLKDSEAVSASIVESVALFMRRADKYFKDHEGFQFI